MRQQRGGAGPRAQPAFLQSCAAGRVPCNSPMITSPIPDDRGAPPATRHPGIPPTGRHPAVTFVAQALARPPWHREVSPKAGPARRMACALPRGHRRRRATHLTGSISAILSAAAPWVAPGVAARGVVLLARHARRRAPHALCYKHPGRCAESHPERPRAVPDDLAPRHRGDFKSSHPWPTP